MESKNHIKSLEKCFNILDLLSAAHSPLKLEEITRKSQYKKTTCFRLLKTMIGLGYVEQNPVDKTYRFGNRLVSLGLSALKDMSLRRNALPVLEKLRDETGETVNLSILSGTEILFVERIMSDYLVNVNVNIGDRLPVHCASMGKVILAFSPKKKADEIISKLLFESKTDCTITSISSFKKELKEIKKKGFALNDEELEKGLRAVAAPIFNYTDEAFAAINIAWTTTRKPGREYFTEFAPKIVTAAEKISTLMGYRRHP